MQYGTRFPLTAWQRPLWALWRLSDRKNELNMQITRRIQGQYSIARLESALHAVVRRHSALRTVFIDAAQPCQEAIEWLPTLVVEDLAPNGSILTALNRAAKDIERPFELCDEPPLRAHIYLLNDGDAVLTITVHHIICDAVSTEIMMRELIAAYDDQTISPADPLQYFEYYQRLANSSDSHSSDHLRYWINRLLDCQVCRARPHPEKKPDVNPDYAARLSLTLPATLSLQIRDVCRGTRTTYFMLVAAGLTMLIKDRDACHVNIAVPTTVRPLAELWNTVGCFINTVIYRVQLDMDSSFRDLLLSIRELALEATEYSDVPFQSVLREWRRATGNASLHDTSDLFRVVLDHGTATQLTTRRGTSFSQLDLPKRPSKTDVTYTMAFRDDRLILGAEYSQGRFSEDEIRSKLLDLSSILNRATLEPAMTLRRILPYGDVC